MFCEELFLRRRSRLWKEHLCKKEILQACIGGAGVTEMRARGAGSAGAGGGRPGNTGSVVSGRVAIAEVSLVTCGEEVSKYHPGKASPSGSLTSSVI